MTPKLFSANWDFLAATSSSKSDDVTCLGYKPIDVLLNGTKYRISKLEFGLTGIGYRSFKFEFGQTGTEYRILKIEFG